MAEKADKTYVDTQIQSVASGSPKGVYATLTDLQTAYPTGNTNIYVVTANGNWYYWNGSAWTSGGVYQSTGITPKSITPSKTDFFVIGKNLFDKAAVTNGYTVAPNNGTLVANATISASDWIAVEPNTEYIQTEGYAMAFYDANKAFISGGNFTNFTTPANCAYVRLSIRNVALATYQLEKGSVATPYEAYYEPYIQKSKLEPFSISDIPTKSIQQDKIANEAVGNTEIKYTSIDDRQIIGDVVGNLFDISRVADGKYISYSAGTLNTNPSYYASDFIHVKQGVQITVASAYHYAWYDANKVYLSGVDNTNSDKKITTTPPAEAVFLRFSSTNATKNNQAVVEGTTVPTPIPKYQKKLSWLRVNEENLDPELISTFPSVDEVLAFLPSEICIAVGRTIELYNKQVVWCGNIENYHFKWECAVGKAFKRKWSFAATETNIGEYPLTLTIYNNNMLQVATASTIIKIVSNVIESPLNLLTIGDSLSNNKAWLGEVRTLSNNQITHVGTRGFGSVMHEGRSGFSVREYLLGTSYAFEGEGVHPFWDGARSNWNYYKTNTGINPNAVQIFLGTNEIELDPTSNAEKIKQIVDYIRQDDATIPIFLAFTLYRGNQDGIAQQISSDGYSAGSGVWKLEEDRKVFNLMTNLAELLGGYTDLHFVPISLTHDSEYNFGAVSTTVNPRATQTELLPSEATHPQTQGYMQFADCMFSVLAAHQ